MQAKTFGRRGLSAEPSLSLARPAMPMADPVASAAGEPEAAGRSLMDFIPFLTVGMIAFLFAVFFVQRYTGLDVGPGSEMSLETLKSQGATGFDLIFHSGQVYRLFLGPILHANASHLMGNCFAMLVVGWRLEPWISRGWLAAIFVISAMGGEAGSLIGNPHAVVGVGASGAISGLIGALFVMSFHHRAGREDRGPMMRTALFFGVPAILPLFLGASGNTDYYAHLGGAIAGAAIGWTLSDLWTDENGRTMYSRIAGRIAMAGLLASCISTAFAAMNYSAYAAVVADILPLAAVPVAMDKIDPAAFARLGRYPKDPRAHLYRGYYFLSVDDLGGAEREFRTSLALSQASSDFQKPLQNLIKTNLALIFHAQGRKMDARDMAHEPCQAGGGDKWMSRARAELAKRHLCD